jgi:hypothetical protein
VSASRPGRFTSRKNTVPIILEAGWTPEPVWTGEENFYPIWIRSPDRPGSSQLLYQLSYPAHYKHCSTYGKKSTDLSTALLIMNGLKKVRKLLFFKCINIFAKYPACKVQNHILDIYSINGPTRCTYYVFFIPLYF